MENFNSLILYLYINCISFFKKIPSGVRENSYRGCWRRRCCRRAQWRTWAKWYIASPEGFDLSEGLEYLKNSWEGSIEERISFKRKEIFKYSAKIKICSIDLCSSLKRVSFLLNNAWSYNAGVEFKDCPRKCTSLKIPYLRIFPFVTKLKIQGCILTYKDLQDIMNSSIGTNRELYLSENTFEDGGCAESINCIEQLINILKSIQECYNVLDLQKCNFSEMEKIS